MNPVNLKVRMVPVQQTVIKSHFHHHILLFLQFILSTDTPGYLDNKDLF